MNIVCVHAYIYMIVIINKIGSLSCSESLTLFILVLSKYRKDYIYFRMKVSKEKITIIIILCANSLV
jgi:uncharacterized membrane protein